jgi:hypothetical protein
VVGSPNVALAPAATGVAATDVANIQTLLTAGGVVRLQPGATHYNLGTTANPLTVPANTALELNEAQLDYGGTGWAIIMGNNGALGAALAYGCKVEGPGKINLSVAGGNGIKCVETAQAVRRDIMVANNSAGVSTGIAFMRDGGNTADILGVDTNCYGEHIKFPHRWGTSGTSVTTSVTASACTCFADTIAGSAGLTVDVNCGAGSRWIGGDIEDCAVGVSTNGLGVEIFGARFEGNTSAVTLGSSSKSTGLFGCIDMATFTDNSSGSYVRSGCWKVSSTGTLWDDFLGSAGGHHVFATDGIVTPSTFWASGFHAIDNANAELSVQNNSRSWHWYVAAPQALRLRDGVATHDTVQFQPNGGMTLMLAGVAGGTFNSGSGAPTTPNGNNPTAGDYYFRTDTPGTANQRIYVCTVGGATPTWVGIV